MHLPEFFDCSFPGRGLFFLFLDAWLFVMLPFFQLGKNAGLFHLFLEFTQGKIKMVVVIQDNSWQVVFTSQLVRWLDAQNYSKECERI
jgi:hypothetical protein